MLSATDRTEFPSDALPDAANAETTVWPRVSSIADLGRILVILHGASAPSEATLKKWSAGGEFRDCRASPPLAPDTEPPANRAATSYSKPGRPGLQLLTDKAIARVYELWPQLAASDPRAVFEEAVARTARQLAAALGPLVHEKAAAVAPPPGAANASSAHGPASPQPSLAAWQQRVEHTLTTLSEDVKELRREMAQFSAMRNNLITRLDEVVARSRETLLHAGRSDGSGHDPVVEARRDRDMGVIKSTMEQIVSALERMEKLS
ncbi:hypothetical protein QTI66_34790 [Variovorax sp. J22R133]|uniref:hypothetical protein n=1 Tax=Variovorax brevis TaxID=3053503 RepID=UPI0025749BA7|nr:hypothetical protein [Variovorax sp. J22R133]MDM0117288.1 hypothetical protein [Variovorax sp. J22R133]